MIVAISGNGPCAGKDTLFSSLQHAFVTKRFAFADKLKEQLRRDVYELTGEWIDPWVDKRDPIGPMLQDFGGMMRRYRASIWVDYLFEKDVVPYQEAHPNQLVVITDCRFPNEAVVVRQHGGKLIRLERDPARRLEDVVRLYGEGGLKREGKEVEVALDDWEDWDLKVGEKPPREVFLEVARYLQTQGLYPDREMVA